MDRSEERAAQLCASPTGCVFLLLAEENNLEPEVLADPSVAVRVAARAIGETGIYWHEHDWVIAAALADGPRLLPFARSVLSKPAAAQWFSPVDLEAQDWLGPDGSGPPKPVGMAQPEPPWHAGFPASDLVTSTASNGMSSALAALMYYAGDYHLGKPPLRRYRVRPAGKPRVLEVDGPIRWHDLCRRYPAHHDEYQLLLDWNAVALDWDAVHLSLGGLLTSDQVRVESDAGWTELRLWEFEQTVWLRWSLGEIERLPDVTDLLDRPGFREPPMLTPPDNWDELRPGSSPFGLRQRVSVTMTRTSD